MQLQDSQVRRFALDAGLVSRKDIDSAARTATERGISLVDALCVRGALTSDDKRRISAYVFGVPYTKLGSGSVEDDALTLIPEPLSRTYNAVAFRTQGDGAHVAFLDLDALTHITPLLESRGLRISPHLTDDASMRTTIAHYQQLLRHRYGDILTNEARTYRTSENDAEHTTVPRIVATLLKHALTQQARDIHIEPHEDSCVVRYRIQAALHEAMHLPAHIAPALARHIKQLAGISLEPSILPVEGRFRMENDGDTVSFRVHITPTHSGERITLHVIRAQRGGYTLEGLGLHGAARENLERALHARDGTIIVAGNGASGKTTTLYTLADLINTPKTNIITIEETIEAALPRIHQTQTRPDLGFDTAAAIRAALRQDPDVVMVSDIEDTEAALLTLTLGERGHLALAGITAGGAADAITRLRAQNIQPETLASIHTIVGQHLMNRLGNAREKHLLTSTEISKLRTFVHMNKVLTELKADGVIAPKTTWSSIPFYRVPEGTPESDAYSGQVLAAEVMIITRTIRHLIRTEASGADILETACKEGMTTFIEDALYKAVLGLTTLDEVWRLIDTYYA